MCCKMLLPRSLKKLQSVYSNAHGRVAENWAEVQITTFPVERNALEVKSCSCSEHPLSSRHLPTCCWYEAAGWLSVKDWSVLQHLLLPAPGFHSVTHSGRGKHSLPWGISNVSYFTSPGSAVVEAEGVDISVLLTSLTVHLQQYINEHVSLVNETPTR